jgi:hypothetical protein
MHLGSYKAGKNHWDAFRDLTPEELERHQAFTAPIVQTRERLSLFRMLERNYRDWKNFLRETLSIAYQEKVPTSEELNRCLLNYLSLAYTALEHFDVTIRRRFKNDREPIEAYKAFLERVYKASWKFAFVTELRGYAQHVG